MSAPQQKSRLGKGLASLIGEPQLRAAALPVEGEQRMVPTSQIRAGKLNPRRTFREEDLAELAESIRARGLVQPIVVRPAPDGAVGFEIVAGERRWRAAQRAGLHQLPVIVRDLSDKEVLELAIIENVHRADLNAMEEATGYRDLIERFGYSQEEVAETIGKSRPHIANTLRLLKLPASVQEMVRQGKLTSGHARALVGRDDARELADRIIEDGLNVRDIEALVQHPARPFGESGSTGKVREKDADARAFEKELSDALGLKVEIKPGSGESGALIVRYGNFDQLDYIRMRLANG